MYRKKLDPAKVHITFHPQRVEVDLGEGDAESKLDIDLYAPIDKDASSFRVLSMKLDIVLVKEDVGQHWPQLTRDAAAAALQPPSAAAAPTAATASEQPRRGFSKVTAELADESDDEAKAGTDIDAFFKQLYSGASEQTRRAMVKSYLESNGTALSTNWDEVSKGTVPTKPPSGMEPKPF